MSAIEAKTKDKSSRVRAVWRDFVEEMNLEFTVNLWSAYYVLGIDVIKLSKTGPLPLWYDRHINRSLQYNVIIALINIYGTPTMHQALKMQQRRKQT